MSQFRLQIVTHQKTVFNESVDSLTMPGEDGSFGVWANHRPIIAVLKPGPVEMRIGGNTQRFTIGEGFFEMEGNRANLLVDKLTGLKVNDDEE